MTDAAIVPLAGLTALQALRDRGQIQSGQQVLINGASGGVGSFAVQIAKLFGATVTGICSTKNLETVRSLGADMVIDYTKTDITRGSAKYDLIFDVVSRLSYGKCRPILTAQGIYVNTDPQPLILLQNWISQARSRLLAGTAAKTVVVQPSGEDLATLKAWIEAGGITPLRDRTYALSDIADAHRYSETGHAVGKIGLSIAAAANA
jgi:NADPH:quinone reductase-like Zn-dependent oxidoreductase